MDISLLKSRKTKPFQLSNWFLVFVIAQALVPQGDMDDPGSWKDKKRSKIMAHSCTRRTLTIVSSILRVCPSKTDCASINCCSIKHAFPARDINTNLKFPTFTQPASALEVHLASLTASLPLRWSGWHWLGCQVGRAGGRRQPLASCCTTGVSPQLKAGLGKRALAWMATG